jgi:hypothetical protein
VSDYHLWVKQTKMSPWEFKNWYFSWVPLRNLAVFGNNIEIMSKNRMKMDSNLFETIIFGGHFANLTLFWPTNSRKVLKGLEQKGDV